LGGVLQVSYAGGSRRDHPAIRYYPPSGDLYYDVLTRLGEAARFETVDREVKEIEGIRVSVATPAAVPESVRFARGTGRPRTPSTRRREPKLHQSRKDVGQGFSPANACVSDSRWEMNRAPALTRAGFQTRLKPRTSPAVCPDSLAGSEV
jgi:hypothetical protein